MLPRVSSQLIEEGLHGNFFDQVCERREGGHKLDTKANGSSQAGEKHQSDKAYRNVRRETDRQRDRESKRTHNLHYLPLSPRQIRVIET